jgi:hypothetical protein
MSVIPRKQRAAAALAVLLWATPATPMWAGEMVPFEAFLAGYANPVFNPDGTLTNTETGRGHAMHLGLFQGASNETGHFTDVPGQLEIVGSFTLTAANGDQVFGTYSTTAVIDAAAGLVHFDGPYVITGGTGRFANATGSGTIRGVGRVAPPFEVQAFFTGKISQPNS